jgi:cardiolipin synthase
MKLRLLRSRALPSGRPAGQAGALLDYVQRAELLTGGNRVQLLSRGAQAFPVMLEAIASARRQIHFETYILRSDATGHLFQAALIERARAGVRVRFMYDSLGSFGSVSNDFLAELAKAGVEIVEYHPIVPWRRRLIDQLRKLRANMNRRRGREPSSLPATGEPSHLGFNRRDHQKIVVVDDAVAFTGGLNIGDEYAPPPNGGDWHDLHVRVEGPAALGLADAFRRAWLQAGGEPFPACNREAERSSIDRPMLAYTCDNFARGRRKSMRRAYRHAINNASASISITNAYFIPDRWLRWALYRAVRRGVVVRIIVPGKSDVWPVWYATRYLFDRMLRRGVRIFEYPEKMMHAKAAVIDGLWSTIGSFNLDRRSMLHNLEAGLVIIDGEFGAAVERQFADDVAQCREIDLVEWRRRRWTQRAVEWLMHSFAYWL